MGKVYSMTIKYLDSKRISALAADTKPTNVETNSILVEKDTANRFWYDGSAWTWENLITRGVFAGGYIAAISNICDYITIQTTGTATDFGDLTVARTTADGVSSSTRGVIGGGGSTNVMDYITIATTGNATDFGDLTVARYNTGTASSLTRGVWAGGQGNSNVMDYITIATTGNATDFGDMFTGIAGSGGNSDNTRGVFAGGWVVSNMEYITIDTTGNGTDFGDLSVGRDAPAGSLEG